MALVSEVKHETEIKDLEHISPEAVLSMLHDVRENIARLDGSFADVDLIRVLEVVEAGKYEMNGSVSTHIDLSSAKGIIKTYRKYSEGGCQSCVNLGEETICAQDADSGWYCQVSDPDYNGDATRGPLGVRRSGFSPKVKRHYSTPCDSWAPRFSPKLEELIGNKKQKTT